MDFTVIQTLLFLLIARQEVIVPKELVMEMNIYVLLERLVTLLGYTTAPNAVHVQVVIFVLHWD